MAERKCKDSKKKKKLIWIFFMEMNIYTININKLTGTMTITGARDTKK